MFEIPLVLENELLRLEYLTEHDFEKLYAVASDPLIWEQHPANDRYKREVFKEFFDGAVQGKAAFMVYCKANNELIGSSRYYEFMPNESVAIGYTFISRKYWGGTYNTSLKKLMLAYAFRHVPKVLFHVGIHNMRSQKAVGKIGGIFVREIIGPAPSTRPSYEYVLTKAEFEQSALFKAVQVKGFIWSGFGRRAAFQALSFVVRFAGVVMNPSAYMQVGVMPQGFMGSGNGSTFQQDPWDVPFLVSDMFFALYNTITGGQIAGGVEKVSIKLAAQKVAKAAAARELKRKIRADAAKGGKTIIPNEFKQTKKFGYLRGQKVYEYKGKYYSKDVDAHNGGVWKVFEEVGGKLKRIGTADESLIIFKK